jgi:hypothetical protein
VRAQTGALLLSDPSRLRIENPPWVIMRFRRWVEATSSARVRMRPRSARAAVATGHVPDHARGSDNSRVPAPRR